MISYGPLWETMRQKGVTQYALIHKYRISPGQLTRLKRNESVSTHTINMFCDLLRCRVEDVMVFIRTDENDADPEALDFLAESDRYEEPGLKSAETGAVYDDESTADNEPEM